MFDKFIENLPVILRLLSFARVFQIVILSVVFTILYTTWDSRVVILDTIRVASVRGSPPTSVAGSKSSALVIMELLKRSKMINGAQLISTDFRANSRKSVFFYSPLANLQNTIDGIDYIQLSPAPLFMNTSTGTPEQVNFAVINNTRMVDIINALFVCYDTKAVLLVRLVPEVAAISPVICSISIPPYPEKFSGYLNLYLSRAPTPDEKDQLRAIARNLASEIFDSEIAKR